MKRVAVIGECMVEYQNKKNLYKQTFGGDTFNCSVYLRKVFKQCHVEYITVVGEDDISKKMISFMHQHNIKTSYIDKIKDKNPGLYILDFINQNRSISYWRGDSAARELLLTRSINRIANELLEYDLIYFSAVTLAVMSEEGRNNLFRILKKARAMGAKVAFDPKYKKSLYDSSDVARKIYEKAIHYCDIFLPKLSDETALWGELDTYSLIQKAKEAGCTEIVIKCGKEEVVYYNDNYTKTVKLSKTKNTVDKTGASDAFNGVYLANRLKNNDIEKSIKKAKKMVDKVIMCKGAILPKKKKANI